MKTTLDNLEQRLRSIDGGAARLRETEAVNPWGFGSSAVDPHPSDVLRLRWYLEESVVVEQAVAGAENVSLLAPKAT